MGEKTYIDDKGYLRFNDSGKLLHRYLARKYIWKKHRGKYPYRFKHYQIHHIDGNKLNNNLDNLQIVTINEHRIIHNITDEVRLRLVKGFNLFVFIKNLFK